jgi:hypothetical protein
VVWYLKNEIISLSFRRIKEESSDGSGSVNHVDFYVISYVLGVCGFASGREGSYQASLPVAKVHTGSWILHAPLHALLIPVRTLHMSILIPTGYPLKIPFVFSTLRGYLLKIRFVFSTLRAHLFKRTSSSRV